MDDYLQSLFFIFFSIRVFPQAYIVLMKHMLPLRSTKSSLALPLPVILGLNFNLLTNTQFSRRKKKPGTSHLFCFVFWSAGSVDFSLHQTSAKRVRGHETLERFLKTQTWSVNLNIFSSIN